jgi:hypothetical protein
MTPCPTPAGALSVSCEKLIHETTTGKANNVQSLSAWGDRSRSRRIGVLDNGGAVGRPRGRDAGVHLKLFSEVYFAATLPALIDLSKEAQMIVVGSRGQGMARRVLLGSVSSGLIHHAHCPVAVIHGEAPIGVPGPSKLPVVVGIDGSPASEAATAIASTRRLVEVSS